MSLLDRVQGDDELYIGGLFTLRRREALQTTGITHVLSVLRFQPDAELFAGFKQKVVEVDDVDDENLLQYFPETNKFIQDALDSSGGILVHCAMGKSRSATCVCAYLIHRYGISPDEALARIRQNRPLAEPNEGFWEQLELYHEMGAPENLESTSAYQRWVYLQEVKLSRACGQAPEAEKIRFEDEHSQGSGSADFDLRCRKCRRTLANSQYLVTHQPRRGETSAKQTPLACSHYFLDPLSWMRPELEQGKLDGRLECPKCKTNVGKYAWQGMQCSCSDWVVPGISLAKGRIDEIKSRTASGPGFGIRVPPSAVNNKGGQGRENL
ncbi:Tyrosine-protein phosphatase yvh1 [Fulvia fulva]|uniref:protein-tyrosine-phosphatase n=1 Tax=Passalora fulva TaxID=5499 RepID=A0A9Q8PKY4_PASFU|nr:Tyrosine-protein phosphatase yvh1 [Fulvia fulva]KAK4611199.1 Tyrosine-protein phosphatase yvh1 [Fulvia fulva]UJO24426.1 Tyrosine-protein phosphatase yvh1 [Fulvia fulva]WPV36713.1 Tyrosine-protein phosphatase yvh1 [Fulvia fulva]